jgi:methylglutaconyl-CoA hydratase
MNKPLHVVRREGALELTLNRPEKRNALTAELIAQLQEALRAAADDPKIRAVILTGAPPAFCSGLDLNEMAVSVELGTSHDVSGLVELFELMDRLEKPVIAAIRGHAIAGGVTLACACDVVVGASSSKFGFPGVRQGIIAPVVMPYLLRRVSPAQAHYMLVAGMLLDARDAWRFGLLDELVSDGDLLKRARELGEIFASSPAVSVAQTKSLVRRWCEAPPERRSELRQLCQTVRIVCR